MKHPICPILSLFILLCSFGNAFSNNQQLDNPFIGMWGLEIEGGGVGWLHVNEDKGYLDAELLWIGGSVLPVANVYLADDNTLVVTRTSTSRKSEERSHTLTHTLRIKKTGESLEGTMTGPGRNGEYQSNFTGSRMPPMPEKPELSKVTYGQPIALFNGKDMSGWVLMNPNQKNGFAVKNGTMVNDPVQPENGAHISYGNIRTQQEFKDFNLTLEVNVPEGNNSGVYLRGIYEIQVVDSYGKPLDSHNMGALYSRITPSMAAEKPAGEWQSMDITLVDRHVTVVLNGKKIIDNEPAWGPTGGAMSADVLAAGPIYLQGDHGKVSYRNIVLTPID
ncbi:3-keto-disaccharide hydrolase [Cyclobacterium plantarum]|uniref:3-keto-disaccharide hydrolase n=1 Tax=Cyclobacterium plantarum TaxID=2716263 RepID=UPI003F72121F